MATTLKAFRGSVLHFFEDPGDFLQEPGNFLEDPNSSSTAQRCYEYFDDALLVVENGIVTSLGDAEKCLAKLPADIPLVHYKDALIVPGFIDTHTHYPQTEIIASYGEQLLEWLESYTFPAEKQFEDHGHAFGIARFFINQLLNNGTTTALVFGTVHPQSVDAFFSAAEEKNLRMICGKVLMDCNAPDYLLDTPQSGYDDSKKLIEKWHGRGRLHYAVTPRFAPTSSIAQLNQAGKLLQEYPDVYMHTHLSENTDEVAWVQRLFSGNKHYVDIYDRCGLLGKRSVFAHGIHLCEDEYQRLQSSASALAFCPSSNLFLGSGLFNLDSAQQHNIRVGLGTDIGAGTSFSLLQTLSEAYKVQQLRGKKLTPLKSFYLATLGGARALSLDDKIGNLTVGKEADFTVLDYNATPLISLRIKQCKSLLQKLFALSILGDDRTVKATYVMGENALNADTAQP